MTTTSGSPIVLPPPGRSARRRGALVLAGSLLVGAAVAGVAGVGPAQAGEPDRSDRPQQVRLCDPSGCLVAGEVVDSDGDGVSDADELVAGTDPYRADSVPALRDLVELSADRRLPSFEAGRSVFVLLPADLVERAEKLADDRLGAYDLEGFPLPARGDSLKRLGIDEGQLKELGIDPARSGMTIGLDENRKEDSGLPARRVGGVDMRLISDDEGAGGTTPTTKPGGSTTPTTGGGSTTPTTGGGSTTPTTGGSSTPTTGGGTSGGGTGGGTGTGSGGSGDDDLVPLTGLVNGGIKYDGVIDGVHFTWFNDGSSIAQGNGWGFSINAEGDVVTWRVEPDKDHSDPDATTVDGPTPEQVEAVARRLGSVTRTVDGWRGVDTGGEVPTRKGTLVAYVESGTGLDLVLAFADPKVTTAQPEAHPDLPNPGLAAPTGGDTPGSCGNAVCAG